jgi:hypothetical protein
LGGFWYSSGTAHAKRSTAALKGRNGGFIIFVVDQNNARPPPKLRCGWEISGLGIRSTFSSLTDWYRIILRKEAILDR